MAGNDHASGALVLPGQDNTYDQLAWINMTIDRISGIMTNSAHIASRLPTAKAAKSLTEGEHFASESHASRKLRHGLSATYEYSRLSDESDYIRVLLLLPGQRDDPIRARLEPCSLSVRPSYEAISYAWGSRADNAVVIICKGGIDYKVEIPKSLHEALKRLRHHSESRLIWADAICINQADDKEKNHQVRLMRKIYQRASNVVIWLGDGDNTSYGADSLFEVIKQMNPHNQVIPSPEDRETWTALGQFYNRPWFTRVWCLQEAILAPSAKVMLGEHSTSWEHVGLAATSIRQAPAPAQDVFNYDALVGVHNAHLMYWLSQDNKSQQYLPFLTLLALTRQFMATDFRDKIYGILGIPTTDSNPDAGEPFLRADYTETLSEVYIRCALAIIQKTQSLRLLSYVEHDQLPTRTSDFSERIKADDTLVKVPSWVPRWHAHSASTLSQTERRSNAFGASAFMSLHPQLKIEVRGRELVTYGARVSPVKSVSLVRGSFRTLWHTAPERAVAIWAEAFDHLAASTTNLRVALYALSILLTAGRDRYGRIITDREQHFADFLPYMYEPAMPSNGLTAVQPVQSLERFTQASRSHRIVHANLLAAALFRARIDFALPRATKRGRASYFQEATENACNWRRLIVTEDGHVGLGPRVTEPGDVVCILGGGAVPLLLRPEGDGNSFKLVGEAYVQGMMFGEITIPEPEQIVLSEKPFVNFV